MLLVLLRIRITLMRIPNLDPVCHSFEADADPDPNYHFHADPYPDPTFHFDADPNPSPSFQNKGSKPEIKCFNTVGSYSIPTFFASHLQIDAKLVQILSATKYILSGPDISDVLSVILTTPDDTHLVPGEYESL